MTEFSYKDIKFQKKDNTIRGIFLKRYYFDIPTDAIEVIGKFDVKDGAIIFSSGRNIDKKWNNLLDSHFNELYNLMNHQRTVYIHSNSGIPLIGTNYFGIIDRNTNLIELRPNTGCNMDCIYCSVNEGTATNKTDFVVEKDYMIEVLKEVIESKGDDDIEVHINPQGEPLLYEPLADLIADAANIPEVKRISMNTNAFGLTEEKADELFQAGLTNMNISIDCMDDELAKEVAGTNNYKVNKIIDVIRYIANTPDYKNKLLLAPLYMHKINDEEMEKLIQLCKELGIRIGIQNFLKYKNGKKPCKELHMDKFYKYLQDLEKKYDYKLIQTAEDFNIHPTKPLENPFNKGDVIKLDIISPGRAKNEMIGVAYFLKKNQRAVIVKGTFTKKGLIKAKIIRRKHNIFHALPA